MVASNVNFAAIAFAANAGRASKGMANDDKDDAGAAADDDDDVEEGSDEASVSALCSANEWCNAASERTLCDSNTRDSAEVGDDKSAVANARSLASMASSILLELSVLIWRAAPALTCALVSATFSETLPETLSLALLVAEAVIIDGESLARRLAGPADHGEAAVESTAADEEEDVEVGLSNDGSGNNSGSWNGNGDNDDDDDDNDDDDDDDNENDASSDKCE